MLTLILGGARSGKSDLAQRIADQSGRPVVFIATMEALDDEVRLRIDEHRAARPAEWRTVEAPIDIASALGDAPPGTTVVIDCLTLWVSNLLLRRMPDPDAAGVDQQRASIAEALTQGERLAEASEAHEGAVIVVSNEVGLGVVPAYASGRAFRDALGGVNRVFARRAQHVLYAVAGVVLDLRALGGVPVESYDQARP